MQFGAGQDFFLSLFSGGEEVNILAAVELGATVSKTIEVSVTISISVVTSVAVAKLCCIVNIERYAARHCCGIAIVRSGCDCNSHSRQGDQYVRRRAAERNCDTGAGEEAPEKIVVGAVVPATDVLAQLESRRSRDDCSAEREDGDILVLHGRLLCKTNLSQATRSIS